MIKVNRGIVNTCEKHGKYQPIEFGGRKSKCPVCVREKQAMEDRAAVAEREKKELERRLEGIRIPPRFFDKTLDNFSAHTYGQINAHKHAIEYAVTSEEALKTGRSMLFVGRPGTGKTHLAIGIARQFICEYGANADARYVTLIDMIEQIKDCWRRDTDAEHLIDFFSTVKLLIIDEISSAYNTANERIQFFRIINKRYENMLPTILISNTDLDETKKIIGEAAYDRLRENGGSVVTFNWDSYRGTNRD